MTQNFISECLANGVEIHEIDFMQRRHVVDECVEFGQSFRRECFATADGDVDVGMRPSGPSRPGAKPDDIDVRAEDLSGQSSDFLRDLSRPSDGILVEHMRSVAILTMMSTKHREHTFDLQASYQPLIMRQESVGVILRSVS